MSSIFFDFFSITIINRNSNHRSRHTFICVVVPSSFFKKMVEKIPLDYVPNPKQRRRSNSDPLRPAPDMTIEDLSGGRNIHRPSSAPALTLCSMDDLARHTIGNQYISGIIEDLRDECMITQPRKDDGMIEFVRLRQDYYDFDCDAVTEWLRKNNCDFEATREQLDFERRVSRLKPLMRHKFREENRRENEGRWKTGMLLVTDGKPGYINLMIAINQVYSNKTFLENELAPDS